MDGRLSRRCALRRGSSGGGIRLVRAQWVLVEDRPIASSRNRVPCGSLVVWVFSCVVSGCSTPIVDDAPTVEVPLVESGGHLVVEASLPGSNRPLRFAIDTGALSFVSGDLAEVIASGRPKDAAKLTSVAHGANGFEVPFEFIRLRVLTIGSLSAEGFTAAMIDSPMLGKICPPLDGGLGAYGTRDLPGFLERVAVAIDLDERSARFGLIAAPDRISRDDVDPKRGAKRVRVSSAGG